MMMPVSSAGSWRVYVDGEFHIDASYYKEAIVRSIATEVGTTHDADWLGTKIHWIEEWILDPATTKAEVQSFSTWARGTAALPRPDDQITFRELVQDENYRAAFYVHVDVSSVSIAHHPFGDPAVEGNDMAHRYETKEGFLGVLHDEIAPYLFW